MATAPTGRHPKSLDSFVLGDEPLVFRVGASAELMTASSPAGGRMPAAAVTHSFPTELQVSAR